MFIFFSGLINPSQSSLGGQSTLTKLFFILQIILLNLKINVRYILQRYKSNNKYLS